MHSVHEDVALIARPAFMLHVPGHECGRPCYARKDKHAPVHEDIAGTLAARPASALHQRSHIGRRVRADHERALPERRQVRKEVHGFV